MHIPKNHFIFTTVAGDKYFIPEPQYDDDIKEYHQAVSINDERTMLTFEEGLTGWIYTNE